MANNTVLAEPEGSIPVIQKSTIQTEDRRRTVEKIA